MFLSITYIFQNWKLRLGNLEIIVKRCKVKVLLSLFLQAVYYALLGRIKPEEKETKSV